MSTTYTEGGLYKGKIVKWGLAESKAKKTPQIFYTILIESETDDKGAEYECPSNERTVYRALTESTVDWVLEELAKLGFSGTSFAQLDPAHAQAHDFTGTEVVVKCKHEEYNGKTQERFEFQLGGGGPAQMEQSATKKLDSMFGAKLKAIGKEMKHERSTKLQPAKIPSKVAPKTPMEAEIEEIM